MRRARLAVLLFAQGCLAFEAREADGLGGMSDLLTEAGFPQFASPDFLEILYEVLGYNCVADLALILEDEEFSELGIRHDDARVIQRAAKVRLVAWRLAELWLEDSAKTVPAFMLAPADSLASKLHDAGYEEPESLRWLELKEALQLGLSESEWRSLSTSIPSPQGALAQHDEL